MKPLLPLFVILSFLFVSCDDSENAKTFDRPKVELAGQIFSVTNTPLQSVEVELINVHDESVVSTTKTNNEGLFRFKVYTGTYTFKINHDGYSPYAKSIQVGSKPALEKITLEGNSTLSGFIINSQTATGLSGTKISFRRDQTGSDTEGTVEFVLTTDDDGYYHGEKLPSGKFIAFAHHESHFTREVPGIEIKSGENELPQMVSVEQPDSGALRIVLTWGESPGDVDGHLFGPSTDGSRFHLYWRTQNPTPEVTLDVDVRNGFGPETITINKLLPGSYRYALHNYYHGLMDPLGGAHLSTSPCLVELYDTDGLIQAFPVPMPTETGDLNIVNLFDIIATEESFTVNVVNTWALGFTDDSWGRTRIYLKD